MPSLPEYVDAQYTFEQAAQSYDCRPDYPPEFYHLLFERLAEYRDRLGLDLGCGSGRVAIHLAQQGWRVIAADLAQRMLDIVGEKLGSEPVAVYPLRLDAACLPVGQFSLGYILTGQAYHWMRRITVAHEVLRVLQPDGLWVVFWTQPSDSDSLCTRLTREFLMATIPGYSPQAALDLEGKHTLPEGLPFRVEKVAINYRSVRPLSQYVESVTSWSFVANSIHNLPEIQQFKAGLYQRLVRAGIDQVVEEQMSLTVLVASRKDDPVQIALVS